MLRIRRKVGGVIGTAEWEGDALRENCESLVDGHRMGDCLAVGEGVLADLIPKAQMAMMDRE